MILTDRELTALVHVGVTMIYADGKAVKEETDLLAAEIAKKTLSKFECKVITDSAEKMSDNDALWILANMTEDKKKYVSGLMASIMVCDGNIDPLEMELWQAFNDVLWENRHIELSDVLRFWVNNQ